MPRHMKFQGKYMDLALEDSPLRRYKAAST